MFATTNKLQDRNEVMRKVLADMDTYSVTDTLLKLNTDFDNELDLEEIKLAGQRAVYNLTPNMLFATNYYINLKKEIEIYIAEATIQVKRIRGEINKGNSSKQKNEELMSRIGTRDRLHKMYNDVDNQYVEYFELVSRIVIMAIG